MKKIGGGGGVPCIPLDPSLQYAILNLNVAQNKELSLVANDEKLHSWTLLINV